MKRFALYCLMAGLMILCVSLARDENKSNNISNSIRIAIVESEHGGYGYDIFVNEKLSIHQPHIPAIDGVVGFVSKDDASKVARTVVNKIKQDEMPPVITANDLEKLNIRH